MNAEEYDRLQKLLVNFVSFDFIDEFYGIKLGQHQKLLDDFNAWCRRNVRRDTMRGEEISRSAWESYLQAFSALPVKWAAVQFGMTEESLRTILTRFPTDSPRNHRSWEGLVIGDLKHDFLEILPGMKHKLFANYDGFCRRLHASILEAENVFGARISVQELICETSKAMGSPLFAHDFDAITLKPLSLPHQLWLNFGKPLNLSPDRVSKLFYVQYQKELQPYLMTSREPDGLETYKAVAQGQPT
jgi:hypothetical protein